MSLKTSTGLRNRMLDTAPARTILAGGVIHIYGGLDRPPDRARQRRGEDLAADGVRTAYQAGNLTSFNGMRKAPMWRLVVLR